MRTRQSFLALCCDRDLRVAKKFLGILGGLGLDGGLLCRNRDLSALCRDRNLVSQQGLGLGQAWARQGSPYVAIEFSQGWDILVAT